MSFRIRGGNASCAMSAADPSKNAFLELKKKKTYRYLIFKINEKKNEVVVEKVGGPAETYDNFAKSLPEDDCRYAVYDFDFVTSENCQKSKIFFIAWYGLLRHPEFVQRCFMPHPEAVSRESWMAFITRFRRLTPQKWTLKSSEIGLTKNSEPAAAPGAQEI